jgi:hypothetical protein
MTTLSDPKVSRLELLTNLHSQGMTDLQISNYLNDREMYTPSGKKYYPELVYGTRKKYKNRKIRQQQNKKEITKIDIHF